MSVVKCYTDASYCPKTKIGCIYFEIYDGSDTINSGVLTYNGVKNSELEKLGISHCIERCKIEYPSSRIIIFTDCESSLNRSYPDNIEVVWTKGHSKNSLRDEDGMRFKNVDKQARKELRMLRKYHLQKEAQNPIDINLENEILV
jgi:hypothetical protein